MQGKILAACLAAILLIAVTAAAPATRLEKALAEADLAYRADVVSEIQSAANAAKGAVAGGSGGNLFSSLFGMIFAPMKSLMKMLGLGGHASGGVAGALASAEHMAAGGRSRRDVSASEARLDKALTEADAAFRTASLAQIEGLANLATSVVNGNSSPTLMQKIFGFISMPFTWIGSMFGHKSTPTAGAAIGDAVHAAENLAKLG